MDGEMVSAYVFLGFWIVTLAVDVRHPGFLRLVLHGLLIWMAALFAVALMLMAAWGPPFFRLTSIPMGVLVAISSFFILVQVAFWLIDLAQRIWTQKFAKE